MKDIDSLKSDNNVTVTVLSPEDKTLYNTTRTGFHTVEEAIAYAVSDANLEVNPEDCVFVVANDTTGVTHRYRINAHGNLKLIV